MQDRSDTFATIREMKTLQDAMSKNLVQLSDNLNEFEDEITTKTDLQDYNFTRFKLDTKYGLDNADKFKKTMEKRMNTYGKIITNIEKTALENRAKIDSLEINSNFERETGFFGRGAGVDPKFQENIEGSLTDFKEKVFRFEDQIIKNQQ